MKKNLTDLLKHLKDTEEYFVELMCAIERTKNLKKDEKTALRRKLYTEEDRLNNIIKNLQKLAKR